MGFASEQAASAAARAREIEGGRPSEAETARSAAKAAGGPQRHQRSASGFLLRAGRHRIALGEGPPAIMGILNIGLDSVADELRLAGLAQQIERAEQLRAEGAQIIDIGVQSARTDTPGVSVREELAALLPLVGELAGRGICLSIDTWRSEVAEPALAAGAAIINDVSGLADPRLAQIVARHDAALVVMHTRARPKERHFPGYRDVVADALELLRTQSEHAISLGLGRDQILLDPGLDFAKTPAESIQLLRRIGALRELGLPLLLAASRKYFLGMLTAREPLERLAGSLAAAAHGATHGVHVVRVHDVAATADMLRVTRALSGEGPPELIGDAESDALRWIAPKG